MANGSSSGRFLLDPFGQGTRKGTAVLADKVPAIDVLNTIIKSVWKLRQQLQQEQQDTQRGVGKPLAEHSQGKPIGTPNPRGTQEHDFEVELRIQRTLQDAVLEDQ